MVTKLLRGLPGKGFAASQPCWESLSPAQHPGTCPVPEPSFGWHGSGRKGPQRLKGPQRPPVKGTLKTIYERDLKGQLLSWQRPQTQSFSLCSVPAVQQQLWAPTGCRGAARPAPLPAGHHHRPLSLQFLSLDDIKDSSQGSVDMRRDQQPSVREPAGGLLVPWGCEGQRCPCCARAAPVRPRAVAATLLFSSPQAVNIVPLTPMSLVPPEEAEKKNNPLFR